jgi:hypothetical protein
MFYRTRVRHFFSRYGHHFVVAGFLVFLGNSIWNRWDFFTQQHVGKALTRTDERIETLFKAYDSGSKGYLTKSQLLSLLKNADCIVIEKQSGDKSNGNAAIDLLPEDTKITFEQYKLLRKELMKFHLKNQKDLTITNSGELHGKEDKQSE